MPVDLSKLSDDDLAALQKGDLSKVSDEGLSSLQDNKPIDISFPGSKYLLNSALGKALSGGTESALAATPAAAAGAAEGATFGGATHLAAGAMSAADLAKQAASGDVPNMLGAPAKWREYQQMLKGKENVLKAESPVGYTLGELGGTLAAAPLVPELGGAKAISLAGKASPVIDRFLAGQAGGGLAKMAGKGAAGAIEGAPLGALVGATGSDASTPEDFAADVASGVGMGSLGGLALGAGVQAGKSALSSVPELAQKWDFTRKLGSAYNMGKEGMNFDTSAGKGQVGQQLRDIPNNITDKIMQVDRQLGQNVGDSLTNAQNEGIKINIDPELANSSNELFKIFNDNPTLLQTIDPKSRALIMKAGQGGLGDLSPLEARALKDNLYDLGDKLNGLSSDAANIARQKGMDVGSALDSAIKEQIPEYKDAAQKFAEFRSSIPEVLLQPDLPADKRTKMLGSLKNKDTDLYKGAQNVFGKAILPGADSVAGPRTGLNEITGNLKKLQQSNPDAVAALGGTPEQVGQNWQNMADKMAVLRQSQGFDPNEGLSKTIYGQLVGAGEGSVYSLANRAGRMMNTAGQTAPVKMATQLFNSDNGSLMNLAQKLKGTTGGDFFGKSLEKALQNKSDMGKNAVLFQLMQIPEYRKMLESEGYSDSTTGAQ